VSGPRIKVLSIVGPGRSGTTLLSRILSQLEGIVIAGELRWLWQRSVVEHQPCGCSRAQTGCPVWSRIVVDTSKRPHDAAVLAVLDTTDHYIFHIVRDPRAITHSWRRIKPLPPSTGRTAMATRHLLTSISMWLLNCISAELLRCYILPDRWLFSRCEDFARNPGAVTDQILAFLGEPARGLIASDRTVVLDMHHTVEGNPNRFGISLVDIIPDDEWRLRMPRRDQACVTAATMPFLLRYGYPILNGHRA
jgi:hypothetical protein